MDNNQSMPEPVTAPSPYPNPSPVHRFPLILLLLLSVLAGTGTYFLGKYVSTPPKTSSGPFPSPIPTIIPSSILPSDQSKLLTTEPNSKVIMATGTFFKNGTVTLGEWYILPEGEQSTIQPGPYMFEYQNKSGAVIYKKDFDVSFTLMGTDVSEAPFIFTIPFVSGVTKIVIKKNNYPLVEKNFSPNPPSVTIIAPNGREQISGQTAVRWSGNDADNDNLTYTLLYSDDDGKTWGPITGNLKDTFYDWNLSNLPPGNLYLIKIVVTDGINTNQAVSASTFSIQ